MQLNSIADGLPKRLLRLTSLQRPRMKIPGAPGSPARTVGSATYRQVRLRSPDLGAPRYPSKSASAQGLMRGNGVICRDEMGVRLDRGGA